jgi:carbon storage regulator
VLVLSRRAGESILIGGEIEVVILGTDGGQVRVGIRAPRTIPVLRKELIQEDPDEIQLAVTSSVSVGLSGLPQKSTSHPAR